ncbi:MAG: tyrosine--tRNA ligase [Candidatus Eisenbacteria bacterium]|uniref:Tyrosine--tRNA ligase n=1 Tax=Eiseniibacteriota bacterium TaxID=2212470 RepID=A0A538TB86_UNCEI|nr:MAG: tyrosine--tRNA ligase [Candidatus Eisenbacteria bacterium]
MHPKSKNAEVERQLEVIRSGVEELIPEDELIRKLERSIASRKPLRVKQGFDPTAPDIHLGHTIGLRKLRQFQDLGHQVVLIVGSYTALVGDPSGRSQTRPTLTEEAVLENAQTYLDQFFKVVDKDRTEVRWNGEWFKAMSFVDVLRLTSRFTVARMLERDDFEHRFKLGEPISVHELLYPLMQAYDSVVIHADIEIGATEQKFNLLTGRDIQAAYGVEPQIILTLPVLEGTDGVRRMSKTLGNYIGITEPPKEIYGKVMSLPDKLIERYFRLVTDATSAECDEIARSLRQAGTNPMTWKKALAHRIVRMYHGQGAADFAQGEFEKQFSRRELPSDLPTVEVEAGAFRARDLMMRAFPNTYTGSNAGSLFKQGAVYVNGERLTDVAKEIRVGRGPGAQSEVIIKVGRKIARVVPKGRG